MTSRPRSAPVLLAVLALLVVADTAAAQDLHPSRRPSPVGIAKTFIGDTYVKVTYGRPYVRGRAIYGDPADGNTYLVPFGRTWRTGANEATEITVTTPVLVAGQRLEAGTYSIFTVPGAERWSVRFNPSLGMDGTGRLDPETGSFSETYDPADDVVVVEVGPTALSDDVEQFTIAFEATDGGADMVLRWERTEVRVPMAVPGG